MPFCMLDQHKEINYIIFSVVCIHMCLPCIETLVSWMLQKIKKRGSRDISIFGLVEVHIGIGIVSELWPKKWAITQPFFVTFTLK